MSNHSQYTKLRDGARAVSWDASTVCTQCCDGVSNALPLEPRPLGIEGPSGLSRMAQLSAAQSIGVPFMPAYCHEHGGVVLDRIALHGGDKSNWHSTALRLRLSSLLDKNKRPQHPRGLLGVSFRARAAAARSVASQSATARRSPLTVNVSSDVHRLDHLGFLSRTDFTAAHIPSTTVALRQDLNAGSTLNMAAHVNRPFATSSTWKQVPMVAAADWTAAPHGRPFTLRLGCEHVSSAPDPHSWKFADLSHSACLHGAALLTLCATSRPPRAAADPSQAALEGSASDIGFDGIGRHEAPSHLARVVVKRPDGSYEDLGRCKRQINIVQRQDACSGPATMQPVNAPAVHARGAGPLWASGPSNTAEQPPAVPSFASTEHSRRSAGVWQGPSAAVAEARQTLADSTAALQRTSAPQIMAGLQKQMQELRAAQRHVRRVGSAVQGGELRKAFRSRRAAKWLSRRPMPWLWNASPGFSAGVQLGAAVRAPLQADAIWSVLRQARPRTTVSEAASLRTDAASQGRGFRELWGRLCEPVMPLVWPSRAQPIMRVRLEGTVGKFRRAVLDHTSIEVEVETCCRGFGAASVGPALLTGCKPAGMFHAASVSARQQLLGPLRAFADMRWEVWPAQPAATAGAGGQAEAGSGSGWMRPLQARCQGLRAERVGCNVGADVCLGFARASVWYSLTKRQGMVELRV